MDFTVKNRVHKRVVADMRRAAKLYANATKILQECEKYFEKRGFSIDELRRGNGCGFDEIERGVDVTDELIAEIEKDFRMTEVAHGANAHYKEELK